MNSIKCNNCQESKKLIDIVKTTDIKGVYHCKDCATDVINEQYDPFMTGKFNDTPISSSRIPKILKWCLGFIFIMMITNVSGALLDNLDAYYSFDAVTVTGSAIDELTGNYSDGVLVADTHTVSGKVNEAMDFDGIGDYINSSGIVSTTPRYTINYWFKADAITNYDGVITNYEVNKCSLDQRLYNTNAMRLFHTRAENDFYYYQPSIRVSKWYMVTQTYDGTTVKHYINAELNASQSETYCTSPKPLIFGIRRDVKADTTYHFNGQIDEFGLWSEALTLTDIQDLYNSGNGRPSSYIIPTYISVSFFNDQPKNDSVFSGGKIYFNTTGVTTANCSLFINGSLDTTIYGLTENNQSAFNVPIGNFSQGLNEINVSCIDASNGDDSEIKYIFVDTVSPVIDYIKAIQQTDFLVYDLNNSNVDTNIKLNISCTDANLFYMNVTMLSDGDVNIDFNNYTENLTGGTYVDNSFINLGTLDEEKFNLTVSCADAHTLKSIPNIPNWAIENGHQFDHVGITTNTADFTALYWTKQDDKYNFSLKYSQPKNDIRLFIGSLKPIHIYGEEKYLITGKYWLDFINHDGWTISGFNRISDKIIRIDLHNDVAMDLIRFQSIGLINIVTQKVSFDIDTDLNNVYITAPKAGKQFNTTDTIKINVTYIANYTPDAPDNCSLIFNNTQKDFDATIFKAIPQNLNANLSAPPAQHNATWSYYVRCYEDHLHPPLVHESHLKQSPTRNLTLFNYATTTTTTTVEGATTTTTLESDVFQSSNEAWTITLITIIWLCFVMASFIVKGQSGRTPMLFPLAVTGFGFFLMLRWIPREPWIGLLIMFTSLIITAGFAFDR